MTEDKWSELEAAAKAAEGSEYNIEILHIRGGGGTVFTKAATPSAILQLLEDRRQLVELVEKTYSEGLIDGCRKAGIQHALSFADYIADCYASSGAKAELDKITGGEHE